MTATLAGPPDLMAHAAAMSVGERVFWTAIYKNGETFSQYQDGISQSTHVLDRSNLKAFRLYSAAGELLLEQEYVAGQCPIYRRRTAMRPGEGVIEIVHVVGWRTKDHNFIQFYYESDGHIETGQFNNNRPMQYEVEYLPHDHVPVG